MATTLAAQLQAIRNVAQLEAEPHKRPFTRPSIPKEAADLDLDTLLSFALSGLEALATVDNRFGWYKVTLFSHKSRDVDRELMGLEENKSLSASISSYLRLLAGFLNMHFALNTLEYLIRRCKWASSKKCKWLKIFLYFLQVRAYRLSYWINSFSWW